MISETRTAQGGVRARPQVSSLYLAIDDEVIKGETYCTYQQLSICPEADCRSCLQPPSSPSAGPTPSSLRKSGTPCPWQVRWRSLRCRCRWTLRHPRPHLHRPVWGAMRCREWMVVDKTGLQCSGSFIKRKLIIWMTTECLSYLLLDLTLLWLCPFSFFLTSLFTVKTNLAMEK